LDYWGTFEKVVAGFVKFANRTAFQGAVAACVDDVEVRKALDVVRRRVITYGLAEDAEVRIEGAESGARGSVFRLRRGEEDWGEFRLKVLGTHNVLNACAAGVVLRELGVGVDAIRAGLGEYEGTGRRMELRGTAGGVTVIDDYGHHPTEVRATLEALRLGRPKRLVVLFQPHRYTRTKALMEEFGGAFGAADTVRVMEIYAASESPIAGVTGEALAERIRKAGHRDCRYGGDLDEAVERLGKELREGDVVLTLGAGSVTQAGAMILKKLRGEEAHG
jgi:UDP-N-acetylmuramate--alanine ligase